MQSIVKAMNTKENDVKAELELLQQRYHRDIEQYKTEVAQKKTEISDLEMKLRHKTGQLELEKIEGVKYQGELQSSQTKVDNLSEELKKLKMAKEDMEIQMEKVKSEKFTFMT